MKQVFRYKEVAQLLGISHRHVQNLVKAGLLEVVHFGRSARVTRRSIERLLGHPLDLGTLEAEPPARAGAGR